MFTTATIQVITEDVTSRLTTDQHAIWIEQFQFFRAVVQNGIGTLGFLTTVLTSVTVTINGFHLQNPLKHVETTQGKTYGKINIETVNQRQVVEGHTVAYRDFGKGGRDWSSCPAILDAVTVNAAPNSATPGFSERKVHLKEVLEGTRS